MEKIDTSFFAKERDAELSVVGESVQRADARGHVTGRTQFYEDVTLPQHAAPEDGALDAPSRADQELDIEPALKVPGVVRVLTHKDVPNNWYTILKLIGVGPDDEPVLPEDRVLFMGEQICAVLAETPAGGARRRAPRRRRLRGPAAGLRRRGGDDLDAASSSTAPTISSTKATIAGASASAMSTRRFAAADHVIEHRYESVADRACADRDDRLHRPSPRAMAASPSIPTRRRSTSRSTTWR